MRVKGKRQGVTLFTPVPQPAAAAPSFTEEMRLWQLALAGHRLQHWSEAGTCLQRLRSDFPDSPLAGLYCQLDARNQRHHSSPPHADWDGTHTFDSK